MAGVGITGQTPLITTGTSVITLLQLLAASNQRVILFEMSISFNGTSNTATPIYVEIIRQTSAGTMSSLTLRKLNNSDGETIQTTGQYNATGQPTDSGDEPYAEQVQPQTGFLWQAPYSREIIIKGGERLGLRVTAAASVSALVRFVAQE
jgi:hypothetical protein